MDVGTRVKIKGNYNTVKGLLSDVLSDDILKKVFTITGERLRDHYFRIEVGGMEVFLPQQALKEVK